MAGPLDLIEQSGRIGNIYASALLGGLQGGTNAFLAVKDRERQDKLDRIAEENRLRDIRRQDEQDARQRQQWDRQDQQYNRGLLADSLALQKEELAHGLASGRFKTPADLEAAVAGIFDTRNQQRQSYGLQTFAGPRLQLDESTQAMQDAFGGQQAFNAQGGLMGKPVDVNNMAPGGASFADIKREPGLLGGVVNNERNQSALLGAAGYTPPKPETVTLSEGQEVFAKGPDGKWVSVMSNDKTFAPQQTDNGFTLAPGAIRYDANGNVIAQAPDRPDNGGGLNTYQHGQMVAKIEEMVRRREQDLISQYKDAAGQLSSMDRKVITGQLATYREGLERQLLGNPTNAQQPGQSGAGVGNGAGGLKAQQVGNGYFVSLDALPSLPQVKAAVPEARTAFQQMVADAKKQGVSIVLDESRGRFHRTLAQQQYIWDHATPAERANGMVARPGHSTHGSGIAADLSSSERGALTPSGFLSPNSKAFKWMQQNAWRYGLVNYSKEAWHWVYLPQAVQSATGGQQSPQPAAQPQRQTQQPKQQQPKRNTAEDWAAQQLKGGK